MGLLALLGLMGLVDSSGVTRVASKALLSFAVNELRSRSGPTSKNPVPPVQNVEMTSLPHPFQLNTPLTFPSFSASVTELPSQIRPSALAAIRQSLKAETRLTAGAALADHRVSALHGRIRELEAGLAERDGTVAALTRRLEVQATISQRDVESRRGSHNVDDFIKGAQFSDLSSGIDDDSREEESELTRLRSTVVNFQRANAALVHQLADAELKVANLLQDEANYHNELVAQRHQQAASEAQAVAAAAEFDRRTAAVHQTQDAHRAEVAEHQRTISRLHGELAETTRRMQSDFESQERGLHARIAKSEAEMENILSEHKTKVSDLVGRFNAALTGGMKHGDAAREELADLQRRNADLEETTSRSAITLRALESQRREAGKNVRRRDAELRTTKGQVTELSRNLERRGAAMTAKDEAISRLREANKVLDTDLKSLQRESLAVNRRQRAAMAEVEERTMATAAEVRTLTEELARVTNNLATKKGELAEKEQALVGERAKLKEGHAALEIRNGKIAEEKAEKQGLDRRISELTSQLEEGIRNIATLEQALASKGDEAAELARLSQQLRAENASLPARIEKLEQDLNAAEVQLAGLLSTNASLQKANGELEAQVETQTAAISRLQTLTSELEGAAAAAVDFHRLEIEQIQRNTAVSVSALEQDKARLHGELEGSQLSVNQLSSLVSADEEKFSALLGEVKSVNEEIGRLREHMRSNDLQHEADIEKMRRDYGASLITVAQIASLASTRDSELESISKLQGALEASQSEVAALSENLTRSCEQRAAVTDLQTRAGDADQAAVREREVLTAVVETLRGRVAEMEAALGEERVALWPNQQRVVRLKGELEAETAESAAKPNRIGDTEGRLAAAQAEIVAQTQGISALQAQLAESAQAVLQQTARNNKMAAEVASLKADLTAAVDKSVWGLHDEREGVRDQLKHSEERVKKLGSRLARAEAALAQSQGKVTQTEAQVAALQAERVAAAKGEVPALNAIKPALRISVESRKKLSDGDGQELTDAESDSLENTSPEPEVEVKMNIGEEEIANLPKKITDLEKDNNNISEVNQVSSVSCVDGTKKEGSTLTHGLFIGSGAVMGVIGLGASSWWFFTRRTTLGPMTTLASAP